MAWLRREVFADSEISRETADDLIAINPGRLSQPSEFLADLQLGFEVVQGITLDQRRAHFRTAKSLRRRACRGHPRGPRKGFFVV